jgi:Zn-dependent protease with chaperone function
MTITQEQFDALIGKLEVFSQQQPGSYRLRVGLFALLGYAYIFLVLAGLLALVGLIVSFIVFSRRVNSGVIKLCILLLIPVWLIARSLWVKFPPPQGLKLSRHQAPQLFALVNELTTKLQAPKFHTILLNQEFNAAVVQVPRLGIFGWQENYLLLGLPLMQALSLEQFKAVLAHELGHLSSNHSRFAAWIYRIRKTWMQIYERFHQSNQQGASVLFNRFLDWYWPSFNAYSFVLARMNEYEADRCSAELAGAHNAVEALMNVEIKARFLESSFWTEIQKQVEYRADPPENVYSSMLTVLQSPIVEEKSNQCLEQAFAQKTNNADTHPCLTDRLKSLGYSVAEAQTLLQSEATQSTAAEQLFGETLEQFAMQFNQDWKEIATTPWRQRYAYLQGTKSNLQALEEKVQTQTLTVKEAWERAYYTLELQGDDAALPLLQDILAKEPDHTEANYTLGQILLHKRDAAGIPCIEKAIAQRADWVINGCEFIYNFLCQTDQTEAAQKYRERAEHHHQLLLKAQQERASVSQDDPFKPHSLEASQVNQLKQQVAAYPQIQAAYLVEKVVQYFPDQRLCVLGIVRKTSFINDKNASQELLDVLATNVQLPIHGHIVILNHRSFRNLKKEIGQIDRSLIFQRKR